MPPKARRPGVGRRDGIVHVAETHNPGGLAYLTRAVGESAAVAFLRSPKFRAFISAAGYEVAISQLRAVGATVLAAALWVQLPPSLRPKDQKTAADFALWAAIHHFKAGLGTLKMVTGVTREIVDEAIEARRARRFKDAAIAETPESEPKPRAGKKKAPRRK